MATSIPSMDEPIPPPAGLSQGARVVDTFIAPAKTFTDIRRSSAWWLPLIISAIVGYMFMFAVQTKVGWPLLAVHAQHATPGAAAKFDDMPPEQQQKVLRITETSYKIGFMAGPLLPLLFGAIITGIFMMTVNFVMGGEGKFGQYFAVWMYAGLPLAIQSLLTTIVLFAGGGGENFSVENPLGTNPGFYFPPGSVSTWLATFLSALDLFTIWSLLLLALGYSIVGKVSRQSAAIAVFGWWFLWVLIRVGLAAMRG